MNLIKPIWDSMNYVRASHIVVHRYLQPAILAIALLSAFSPVKEKFTAAERQQIQIATPGLFERSQAFSVDFTMLEEKEYSFPLPVGSAQPIGNDLQMRIVSKKGDAVKAVFDGDVRLALNHATYGNVIVVRHPNGLETVYAQNAQNLVKTGDVVKAGQTIAIIGTHNGKSYCDFSCMVNGARINPTTLIDSKSHRLRKQTVLFEKKGNHIALMVTAAEKMRSMSLDPDEMEDPFAKTATFKLNLGEIEQERWAFPLPGAKVISPYGGKRRHSGVDLKTKPKDNIVAAFDGVVKRSGPYSGYGNCIVISHAYGFETLYSHQYKNLVKVGQKVKAGEVIGLTGRTGRASTEHLHFEVTYRGRRINPTVMFDLNKRVLHQTTLTLTKNGKVTSSKK